MRLPDLKEHPDSYGFPPNHPPMRSFLASRSVFEITVFGNLYLADKKYGEVFTDVDEELVVGLAAAAGVAIENARLHAKLHELALVEDRARVARDLHDTVIQRLFATGMSLQGAARLMDSDPAAARRRVDGAVDDLDVTVKHIRSRISSSSTSGSTTMAFARSCSPSSARRPARWASARVLLDGPLDTAVDTTWPPSSSPPCRRRSATCPAAKRFPSRCRGVRRRDVCLHVIDDGIGPPSEATPRGNGLLNMAAHAERLGGTFTLGPGQRRHGGGVADPRP